MTELTATQDVAHEVKIDEAGPARKRLTITIPAEAVDERLEESMATLAHEAQIPGFRKGKAPRNLIEKRFGSTVRSEARSQLIADAYSKAIEENKVRVVGEPEPGEGFDDAKLEPGKPLTFAVEVETVPEFELPTLEGIEIKKPVVNITDEHITEELQRQLHRHGSVHEVDGDVKPGDRLTGRALVTDATDGSEILDMPEAIVFLPIEKEEEKGHVLGFKIDGLLKKFKGKTIGDTVEVEVTGPENHEREDLRGRKMKIAFTINGAMRIEPTTKESLIEMYGLGDEAKLMEQLKIALEDRAGQEQAAAMREQVYQYVLDNVDIDLPPRMTAQQAQRLLDMTRIDLLYKGMSVEDVEAKLADLRSQSEEEANRRLKLFFTLHAIGDHFKVEVNEQEVNGRIAQMAMQRNERPEQFRAQLAKDGKLQQVAMQIREHKAADRIIDQAKIEEITAEEWNKLVNELPKSGAKGASAGSKKKTTKKTSSKSKSE